jgi:glycosyltransferase involved in cell wall biosynthesis
MIGGAMSNETKHKRSLIFFGYDEKDEGGRAWAVRTGLAENGINVYRCQTLVNGFFSKYRELYRKWNEYTGTAHAVYVIFMGYYLMPLAWYLARRRGIPIILDTLVSQYDTEVNDRRRLARTHPRAWFLWMVDFISCAMADAIVVDTHAHKRFFSQEFFVNPKKIIIVRVGCRSDLFIPLPSGRKSNGQFVVEFHGGFSPLQGIEHIIRAAKILQDRGESICFELTGSGQLFADMTRLAEELGLTNVTFMGRSPLEELPRRIARGQVCLGIFGTTDKALRVIPNKVYECMSCGKPVITERSEAALEALHDGEDVCLVSPGDPAAIAENIIALKNDGARRNRLGERARALSENAFSPRVIVQDLVDWLISLA